MPTGVRSIPLPAAVAQRRKLWLIWTSRLLRTRSAATGVERWAGALRGDLMPQGRLGMHQFHSDGARKIHWTSNKASMGDAVR
jgi:hypothetical protein